MSEQRLIELEIKLAYQEDLVGELNKIVAQQQQKIDHLEKICRLLYERVENLSAHQDGVAAEEIPPHY